jgi:hypothetical protein
MIVLLSWGRCCLNLLQQMCGVVASGKVPQGGHEWALIVFLVC